MINRTVMPVPVWPARPQDQAKQNALPSATRVADVLDREAPAHTISLLLRFLAALVVVCGLTCLYIWQLSNVSAIKTETRQLQAKITQLERDNVDLMLQVAAEKTPAAIEARASALGLIPFKQPVYVALPSADPAVAAEPVAAPDQARDPAAWLDQLLSNVMSRQSALRGTQVASSSP